MGEWVIDGKKRIESGEKYEGTEWGDHGRQNGGERNGDIAQGRRDRTNGCITGSKFNTCMGEAFVFGYKTRRREPGQERKKGIEGRRSKD